jgi:hypothetical protein
MSPPHFDLSPVSGPDKLQIVIRHWMISIQKHESVLRRFSYFTAEASFEINKAGDRLAEP